MQTAGCLSRCVLGTAALGGVWGRIEKEESISTIVMALENGITYIDTAPAYGDAEKYVGIALSHWKGIMPVLSTKVGRLKTYAADEGIYDYTDEGMEKSVTNSLQTLGVPAIDILFLHDPSSISHGEIERIIRQLSNLKKKRYTNKIGLGGNAPEYFMKYEIFETFDIAMEYNRFDACGCDVAGTAFSFYQSQGMEFYAASPLHMGLLGNRYEEFVASPPAWLEKSTIKKAKQVKMIADKNHLSLPSLAHRFLLSLPGNFKIVIGPKDSHQLQHTILDLKEGPLPDNIVKEIMNLKRL